MGGGPTLLSSHLPELLPRGTLVSPIPGPIADLPALQGHSYNSQSDQKDLTKSKRPHIKNLENIGPSLQHRVKFRHLIQNADLVNCSERALVADHK